MTKLYKNIFKILMTAFSLAMCLLFVSIPVDAAENGTCGDNITWEVDDWGSLYIWGYGDMPDFSPVEPAPWTPYLPDSGLYVNISGDIKSIGAYAFYGYTSALTVDLEGSSVMSIGDYAFYDCQNLFEIRFPESIMFIGNYAFYNCGSLQELPQLDLLMNVGEYAFYYCYSLMSLPIGQSTTTIGAYAFANTENISSITFPASVTSIGAYAFECCWSLETVTFEGNAPTIHSDAFNNGSFDAYYDPNTEGWSDILSQTFYADINWYAIGGSENPLLGTGTCGEGLTWSLTQDGILTISGMGRMTDYLAMDTPWLSLANQIKSVVIEDGVQNIGREAFQNCTNLENITVADSVQGIGAYALDGTAWLNDQPDGLVYAGNVVYKYKGTCPASVTLRSNTIGIGAMAFLDQVTLESINFPDSLREICFWAFKGCTGLAEINLNEGLLTIGQVAFGGCNGLTEIIIPDSVTTMDSGAFGSCESVEKLVIGDGLTSLSYSAFSYSTSLKYIEFGSNLRTISNGAFRGCTALEYVNLPPSVTVIEDSAFRQCTALKRIIMPSVSRILYYAFAGCSALAELDFPETLTFIDQNVFTHCTSLTSIRIPDSVMSLDIGCFSDCTALTAVYIGKGVSHIESSSLANCIALTRIDIDPENEYYMSDESGVLHTKDQKILLTYPIGRIGAYTVASTVTKIDQYAFANCVGLTEVTLPDGLLTLEYAAFGGCTALKEITIPDSVTSTWGGTFLECTALEKVWIGNGLKELSATMFQDCTALKEVHLPASLETIGSSAFENCESLVEIIFPDTVTEIWNEAFRGCTGLISLYLPESLKSIRGAAFYHCESLKEVYLPDSLLSIDYEVFQGCYKLETVILPKNLKYISDNVFSVCLGLKSIVIPASVEEIDVNAFSGCMNMKTIKFTGSQEQWQAITFGTGALPSKAQIVYNYERYGKVKDWGITLKDNIGVSFNLSMSDEILADTGAYVTISFDDQSKIISALQAAEGFTLDLAAAQMTKPIQLSISFRHGSTSETMSYTVKQYAEYIIGGNYNTETKNLAAAMLNYGGKAQSYFGYNTEHLADQDISVTEKPIPVSEITQLNASGRIDGICLYGASMLYRNKLAIRYYFNIDISPADLQFTANGKTLTPVEKDGMYYVEVADILPQDLDKSIALEVKDAYGNTVCVNYNPMDYITRMYHKGSNSLKVLLQALYTYHIAAKNYSTI